VFIQLIMNLLSSKIYYIYKQLIKQNGIYQFIKDKVTSFFGGLTSSVDI